jgi:hypothetical protein
MSTVNQDSLPAEVLEKQLQSIAFSGLAFLFNIVREKLKGGKLSLGEIEESGFKFGKLPNLDTSPTPKQVKNLNSRWIAEVEKARAAKKKLMKATKGISDFLVLHFDECQVILSMCEPNR